MDSEFFDGKPVAVITGASSGLGFSVAARFAKSGYQVVMVGRDENRLKEAQLRLPSSLQTQAAVIACDVTQFGQVNQLFGTIEDDYGRLEVLVNVVGESDRGLLSDLVGDRMRHLFEVNVLSSLYCTQQALPLLEQSGGVVLNIGSLASKVGARFLGGYAIAKHGLAALTQQFRLELKDRGIHVCLLSPGPIKREDAGERYASRLSANLPDQASKPGGGTRLKGLCPELIANIALTMVRKRQADRVLPRYLRLLVAIGHLCPALGDWLLLKFTSSKK